MPDQDWARSTISRTLYDGEVLQSALGQGYDLATPLQVMNAFAALGNGWAEERAVRSTPHLVGRAAALIAEMEPDEAVDALRDLEPDEAEELLSVMPEQVATSLRTLLLYREGSAGGLMTSMLPQTSATPTITLLACISCSPECLIRF